MAHIANRSRFRVTVKNKPELTKYFSFSKLTEVEACMKDLRSRDFTPKTKNGRARKLSLRQDLIEVLAELPRDMPHIFDVGLDDIVGAWNKACGMAGIEDLRIHDCRHEALSRVAETGKFSVPELQVFSGHRDIRMLMRTRNPVEWDKSRD